jgi:hypothetical protein
MAADEYQRKDKWFGFPLQTKSWEKEAIFAGDKVLTPFSKRYIRNAV